MNATYGHSPEHTAREIVRLTDQLLLNQLLEGTGYKATVVMETEKKGQAS